MSSNNHTAYMIIMIIMAQHLSSYCFILCAGWLYSLESTLCGVNSRQILILKRDSSLNFQQKTESQVCLFLWETNGHSQWSWTESPHPFPIEKLFLTKTRKIWPAVFFLDQPAVFFFGQPAVSFINVETSVIWWMRFENKNIQRKDS